MKTQKITESEIKKKSVASLPTRPNAPHAFGGSGISANELKEAFDALPRLVCERLNSLIDEISGSDGNITDSIKTGISEEHTLQDMTEDIKSGAFIGYLAAPNGRVADYLLALREDINKLAIAVGIEL